MRIVTWNVLGLTGYPAAVSEADIGRPGTAPNSQHFTGVFGGLDADVIALQEGVTHPIARDIARRMGRHLATFPSPQSWPGHVLSRFPIVESRTFSHAVADDGLPCFSRTAGAALLQVSDDKRLWVVCIHLHPGDVELRAREGEMLRERLEGLLPDCVNAVVLGDFNCDVSEPIHQHLADLGFLNAMATAGGGLQLTMDTAGIKPWKIDHIYLSPALGTCASAAAVIRDAGFRTDPPRPEASWDHSDHLPVRVDLTWP
ncbi:MAG TPA: endonuclease/exonuclease/phosphatase family protein [Candidatus Latescibacteria bacterium]|jgi:endonuclease/exonuclease/phosphatase family metal-dependent hydrolase|nr:endonuclease/exonuclease/phosphatase family protein [Candidatus Latescibacterota bacterium]HJP29468.1 endonuclease/exonuclease/phosphatase family protein [Candidatus Latescibacterota bacterium]